MNYQQKQDLLQEQEYKQRKFWFVFEFKGRVNSALNKENEKFGLPKDFIFNPRQTEATMEEFDKLLNLIIDAGESEFKLIGTHKYNSFEELNKIWK